MAKLSGSCLCGAVSFNGECTILRTVNCHCTDCQNITGSVYGTLVFVAEEELTVTGPEQSYTHTSDSGAVMTKRFCPACGTQLFGQNSRRIGMLGIRAGAIHQKHLVKPEMNIFRDSAVGSTAMDAALPVHAKMPE